MKKNVKDYDIKLNNKFKKQLSNMLAKNKNLTFSDIRKKLNSSYYYSDINRLKVKIPKVVIKNELKARGIKLNKKQFEKFEKKLYKTIEQNKGKKKNLKDLSVKYDIDIKNFKLRESLRRTRTSKDFKRIGSAFKTYLGESLSITEYDSFMKFLKKNNVSLTKMGAILEEIGERNHLKFYELMYDTFIETVEGEDGEEREKKMHSRNLKKFFNYFGSEFVEKSLSQNAKLEFDKIKKGIFDE